MPTVKELQTTATQEDRLMQAGLMIAMMGLVFGDKDLVMSGAIITGSSYFIIRGRMTGLGVDDGEADLYTR